MAGIDVEKNIKHFRRTIICGLAKPSTNISRFYVATQNKSVFDPEQKLKSFNADIKVTHIPYILFQICSRLFMKKVFPKCFGLRFFELNFRFCVFSRHYFNFYWFRFEF